MGLGPIILLVLLPFLALLRWVYRCLSTAVRGGQLSSLLAIGAIWGMIAVLPWLMLFLYVPLANRIFLTFPVLQTAAWDVGLATSLWLGMVVSYVIGGLAGVVASVRLARVAKAKE